MRACDSREYWNQALLIQTNVQSENIHKHWIVIILNILIFNRRESVYLTTKKFEMFKPNFIFSKSLFYYAEFCFGCKIEKENVSLKQHVQAINVNKT